MIVRLPKWILIRGSLFVVIGLKCIHWASSFVNLKEKSMVRDANGSKTEMAKWSDQATKSLPCSILACVTTMIARKWEKSSVDIYVAFSWLKFLQCSVCYQRRVNGLKSEHLAPPWGFSGVGKSLLPYLLLAHLKTSITLSITVQGRRQWELGSATQMQFWTSSGAERGLFVCSWQCD